MNLKLPHGLQDSTGHGHGHGFWGSKNPESLLRSPNLENDPLSMSGILLLLRAMVILWLHRVFGVRICSSYRLLHLVSPAWQQHSPLFTTTFSLTPVTTITSLVLPLSISDTLPIPPSFPPFHLIFVHYSGIGICRASHYTYI